jgi:hypothetical protein
VLLLDVHSLVACFFLFGVVLAFSVFFLLLYVFTAFLLARLSCPFSELEVLFLYVFSVFFIFLLLVFCMWLAVLFLILTATHRPFLGSTICRQPQYHLQPCSPIPSKVRRTRAKK